MLLPNLDMKSSAAIILSFALFSTSTPLVRRGLERCKNLQANSNNGGRKVGIVIDESGSMLSADPFDLRIDAGRAVNDWLISSSEAGNGKQADLVTVIGFDSSARNLYPLGDPAGADKAFSSITTLGGTFIAGGVDEALSEITKSGGSVANTSGIVVLTDGSDSSTSKLVESINTAGQQGIRVSFGFLDDSSRYSYQDPEVLRAILGTGGMYSTINGALAQNAFVNVMIVHGLTDNDNPSSKNPTSVYNGLSVAFVLGSDGTSTLTYAAEAGESLTFAVSSISAGDINVTATDAGGKVIGNASVDSFRSRPEEFEVTASKGGSLELKVQGKRDMSDAMFIVGVNSSIPLTNCTLGESGKSGLSKGAKAGIGVSVPILVGLFAAGSYFAWKFFKGLPPKTTAPPTYAPDQHPMEYKQPYVQTNEVPTNPGWSVPPKPPHIPSNTPNNPTYPTQADPMHPTQADPSHPTQADPSHPTQADPSHPTQADPSHPTQADPNPSHPTQADPNPSHPTSDSNPSQPPQSDPNQPHQPPNDGQDPHPKRLPTPRMPLRLFGRRRKDDKEKGELQHPIHNNPAYPQPQLANTYNTGAASPPFANYPGSGYGNGAQSQHTTYQAGYGFPPQAPSPPQQYSTPSNISHPQSISPVLRQAEPAQYDHRPSSRPEVHFNSSSVSRKPVGRS